MSDNRKILIVGLAILVVIAICLVFALSPPGGGGQSDYDRCVDRCEDDAFEANVDRDDITNDEFHALMRAHRLAICPNECKHLK